MTKVTVHARVGADGVLRVNLPVGTEDAEQEVQVTVESVSPRRSNMPPDYAACVDGLAGSWQGDFERPPQGELDESRLRKHEVCYEDD
jgi:hypothetical protein